MHQDKIIKEIIDQNTKLFFSSVMKTAVSTQYGYQFFDSTQDTLVNMGRELLNAGVSFEAVVDDYFVGHLKKSSHKIIKDYIEKTKFIPSALWLSKYQSLSDMNFYVDGLLSLLNMDECLVDKNSNTSLLAFFESLNTLGLDFCITRGIPHRVETLYEIYKVDRTIIMQYVSFGFDFDFEFLEESKRKYATDFQMEDYWNEILRKNQENRIRNNYMRLNASVENKKFEETKKLRKI